jgi:hypothetical protein
MKYTALIGQMQSGKTTASIEQFNNLLQQEDTLPVFATHPTNNVYQDWLYKARHLEGTILNPRDDRGAFNKLVDHLLLTGEFPQQVGIAGLNNASFHRRLAPLLLHYHGTKHLIVDEYDQNQIGMDMNEHWVEVKRDYMLRSYDVADVLNEMTLLSATNLAGAASKITFDSVQLITPGTGYNCEYRWEQLSERDVEGLRQGCVRQTVQEVIQESEHNVMINIDNRIAVHELIEQAIEGFDTHLINSKQDEGFDFERLEQGKHVIIGGGMFARGQTFSRIQTLILDKMSAHQATLLQAVGRLFGYKPFPLTLACTAEQRDHIESAFEIEQLISKQEVLLMPWEDRHAWIRQHCTPDPSLRVFGAKSGGWRQHIIDDIATHSPEHEVDYDESWFNNPTITMCQRLVEGAPPARGDQGFLGTCKWGNRSVDRFVSDFVNQHPQLKVLAETNERGELRRKTIVPPLWEEWTHNGETHRELEQVDRNIHCREDLINHFYIDNSVADAKCRETCQTPYVGSVRADGRIAIWKNLNISSKGTRQKSILEPPQAS